MEFTSSLNNKLNKTGGLYKGPMSLSPINRKQVDQFLLYIFNSELDEATDDDEFPHWIFELAKDKKNREILLTASKNDCWICARSYNFLSKRTVKIGFSSESPSSVGVIAQLDKRAYKKGKGGPVTWDPNVDHIPSHPDGPW